MHRKKCYNRYEFLYNFPGIIDFDSKFECIPIIPSYIIYFRIQMIYSSSYTYIYVFYSESASSVNFYFCSS